MEVANQPFLCIITPIFDGAVESVKLLIADLQQQTLQDFIHVCLSCGPSPLCQEYISSLKDKKYIYEELPSQDLSLPERILINLGERRNHAFRKYQADRYACCDADLQITNTHYFEILKQHHHEAEILMTKALNNSDYLPRLPYSRGKIDLANFTLSNRVARSCHYPIDYNPLVGPGNDWRFFESISVYSLKLLPIVSGKIAGNNTYKRMSKLLS